MNLDYSLLFSSYLSLFAVLAANDPVSMALSCSCVCGLSEFFVDTFGMRCVFHTFSSLCAYFHFSNALNNQVFLNNDTFAPKNWYLLVLCIECILYMLKMKIVCHKCNKYYLIKWYWVRKCSKTWWEKTWKKLHEVK